MEIKLIVHLVLCIFYIIAGFSAFGVFLWMHFYEAGVLGFITGLVSCINLNLIYLEMKQQLNAWYDDSALNQLFCIGFFTFAFCTSGFVYYLASMLVLNKFPIIHVVALIWSIISAKSGCFLMAIANRCLKRDTTLLEANEEEA